MGDFTLRREKCQDRKDILKPLRSWHFSREISLECVTGYGFFIILVVFTRLILVSNQ